MKKLYFLLIIVLFFSCNKEIPIYEAKEFAKENIAINQEIQKSIPRLLKNNKIYCSSKSMYVLLYDINNQTIDTIIKTSYRALSDFYPINDSCIFYQEYNRRNYSLRNTLSENLDIAKNVKKTVTHPYWKKEFIFGSNYSNPMCQVAKNRWIMNCLDENYYSGNHLLLMENNIPIFIIFDIDKDTNIKPVSFFGWYPKDYPKDNYFNGGVLYYCYNADKKQIVCHTQLHNNVVLCDSMGRREKDVYFGSQLYNKIPFQTREELFSMASTMNLYKTCSSYELLGYDPYRKVYLRVLRLPRPIDKTSIFKEEIIHDFVIIVADESLNIKYEVFFDGKEYVYPHYNFLINEKGVLIFKQNKENEEVKENATWFVFD